MNDDGTMARLPDLVAFGQRHGLKIGTISDLIAYRRRYDNLVRESAIRAVHSEFGGEWMLRVFTDNTGDAEHIVMIKGDISDGKPVLVRMHVVNPLDDLLALTPGRSHQLEMAMNVIAGEGRGVVVVLRDMSDNLDLAGSSANPQILRRYGLGAQILNTLGISDLILLTNSSITRVIGLEGYGIRIVGTRPIPEKAG